MSISFTPNTRPVENRPWKEPVSENLLASGYQHQEAATKQAQQDFTNKANSIFNITAMSPADEEVLNAKKTAFQEGIKNIKVGNLNDPQSTQQINSFISQFSNDKDLLGIAARTNKYKADIQEFQDLQKAEKPVSEWRQKSLQQASKYQQSGKYYADERFTGQIKVDPDIDKWKHTIVEDVKPDTKDVYNPSTGKMETITVKSPQKIALALKEGAQTNGQVKDYFDDLYDNETKDKNVDDEANKYFENLYQQTTESLLSPLSQAEHEKAQELMDQLDKTKQSSLFPSLVKNMYKNNWINQQFQNDAAAYSTVSDTHKWDELALHRQTAAIDFAYNKQKKMFDAEVDAGKIYSYTDKNGQHQYTYDATKEGATQVPGKPQKAIAGELPEVRKTYEWYISHGVPVIDDAGKRIPISDLPDMKDVPNRKNAIDLQNKDAGIKRTKTILSYAKQGNLSTTDEETLENTIGSHVTSFKKPGTDKNYDVTKKIGVGSTKVVVGSDGAHITFKIDGNEHDVKVEDMEKILGVNNSTTSSTKSTASNPDIEDGALGAFVDKKYGGDDTKLTQADIEAVKKLYPKKK